MTTLNGVKAIRLVLEPDGHAEVDRTLTPFRERGIPVDLIASDPNILESVILATAQDEGPFIVTTADNVLLTHGAVAQTRAAMRRADGVIGVTTRERVWAVHPQGQRGFYEFRDAGYANCNL